ncbi:MAG TPA: hypothetical protein PLG23_12395 [Thermoflexales bacterium]|jgi:hypothetical protein|nr:hypothetical protein [Thermoflexales bacterium]HQX12154.1 hypothetical protein [Thermoflexales bacterium]HQY24898.1 hypothetical protein [Thermoflexales bacterium]HQZ54259.1 hypothetical protein [Thermoflexales bacterium]
MATDWPPELSLASFERGLRIDRYISSIVENRDNFRANFVRAIDYFTRDDLLFFRGLDAPIRVAALTDDSGPDTLRDIPIIARLSVEVRTIDLRLFRRGLDSMVDAILSPPTAPNATPVIVFYTADMRPRASLVQRLPEMTMMMQARRANWIAAHPDIPDLAGPPEEMSAVTRMRLNQAVTSLSAREQSQWGRAYAVELRAIAEKTPLP